MEDLIVRSKNIELSDEIRSYGDKKIKNKITRILDKITKMELKLTFEKNPRINLNNIAEVTIFTTGSVIRATDSGADVFEAIDKVSSKLGRLLKKYKDKLVDRGRRGNSRKEQGIVGETDSIPKSIDEKIRDSIVKTKTFNLKPLSPEEAVLQMEMLGHDFFVFINSETGRTAVVYRRKDKNYGLIEPSI